MAALPTSRTFFAGYELSSRDTLERADLPPSHRTITPCVYARQIALVLVITKNTNPIPNCLFVCYFDSHENRRRPYGGLLRGIERCAGVHARLSRGLAPRQERANNRTNRHRIRSLVQTAAWTNRTPSVIKSTQLGNSCMATPFANALLTVTPAPSASGRPRQSLIPHQ